MSRKNSLTMLTILLLSALALCATDVFAKWPASKKEGPPVLRGEHKPGGGYSIYFSKDKSKFLRLSGFSVLKFTTNEDDKMTLPYFRFYFDGQSSKELSFHTRLDYTNNFFMSKTTDLTNGPARPVAGLYFARAYLTYSPTDYFSIDGGRVLSLTGKHDSFGERTIKVSTGLVPKFSYGNLNLKMSFNYEQDSERYANGNENKPEYLLAAARVDYKLKMGANGALDFGVTAGKDFKHDIENEKFYQIMPNIDLTYDKYYLYAEGIYKEINSKPKTTVIKGIHYEAGVSNFFANTSFNLYYKHKQVGDTVTKYYTGVSLWHQVRADLVATLSVSYNDFTNDRLTRKQKTGHAASITYYF